MPKFVVKEMEVMYIDELKASINLLMNNLESLPVTKGTTESKLSMRKMGKFNKYEFLRFFVIQKTKK
jgi:hypothetical protein